MSGLWRVYTLSCNSKVFLGEFVAYSSQQESGSGRINSVKVRAAGFSGGACSLAGSARAAPVQVLPGGRSWWTLVSSSGRKERPVVPSSVKVLC
jgi:hypothetical protein